MNVMHEEAELSNEEMELRADEGLRQKFLNRDIKQTDTIKAARRKAIEKPFLEWQRTRDEESEGRLLGWVTKELLASAERKYFQVSSQGRGGNDDWQMLAQDHALETAAVFSTRLKEGKFESYVAILGYIATMTKVFAFEALEHGKKTQILGTLTKRESIVEGGRETTREVEYTEITSGEPRGRTTEQDILLECVKSSDKIMIQYLGAGGKSKQQVMGLLKIPTENAIDQRLKRVADWMKELRILMTAIAVPNELRSIHLERFRLLIYNLRDCRSADLPKTFEQAMSRSKFDIEEPDLIRQALNRKWDRNKVFIRTSYEASRHLIKLWKRAQLDS